MKTPSNKTRKVNTKRETKPKPKIIKDFHPVTYLIKNIPKPVYVIIALFISFYLYHIFIQPEFDKYIAIDYLKAKYNKDFNVHQDHSAPNWIGKPPTYHGLAKVKDGSDDVEFVVVCRIEGRECSDSYLDDSWERGEEKRIRLYVGDILPQSVQIEVGIVPKIEEYDKRVDVGDFDYYLKKHKERLLKHYLVKFDDDENDSDIETGKDVIKKVVEYINSKNITNEGFLGDYIGVSYSIGRSDDTYSSCDFNIKKEMNYLDSCFESGVRRKN